MELTERTCVALPILVQKDEGPRFSLAGPPGLAVFLRGLDSDRRVKTDSELPTLVLKKCQTELQTLVLKYNNWSSRTRDTADTGAKGSSFAFFVRWSFRGLAIFAEACTLPGGLD